MIEYNVDPLTWFSERELKHRPKHFVSTKTPITVESKKWIYHKLKGRFTITAGHPTDDDSLVLDFDIYGFPSFEDPSEAVLYELTWS